MIVLVDEFRFGESGSRGWRVVGWPVTTVDEAWKKGRDVSELEGTEGMVGTKGGEMGENEPFSTIF